MKQALQSAFGLDGLGYAKYKSNLTEGKIGSKIGGELELEET